MRSLRYVVPVVLFLVVAGFLLLGLDRNPSEIPSPLIGKPAPAWVLPRLPVAADPRAGDQTGGATLEAQALKGRPYLLNVWASWCAPCLQEHPLLLDLARRKIITSVGVNYKDKPEDARAWLARHGNPFAAIVADRDGRTAIDFGVYGVPETFLVDAQGVIRLKHIGALTSDMVRAQLLPAIAALPASQPAPAAISSPGVSATASNSASNTNSPMASPAVSSGTSGR
jgi:cytochrome c biogenesis protein CcmG/thiol:disulfide interchange protein DsbE